MNVMRLIALALLIGPLTSFGQGWYQNGAHVVLSDEVVITINGVDGNYRNEGGVIQILDSATLRVNANWVNNGSDGVFTTNFGSVALTGGIQTIGGSEITSFPWLYLEGTADKTLDVNTQVGGGNGAAYHGSLVLVSRRLILNSNRLIINNPQPQGITENGGGVISESDAASGYGEVQWNVRGGVGTFTVPFQTIAGDPIPFILEISAAGIQSADSGHVVVSTYSTDPAITPNNRPLPTGVSHSNNEYGRENAFRMVDRFWMVGASEFTNVPSARNTFTYTDGEWDAISGSTNLINEPELQPILYQSAIQEWDYSDQGASAFGSNQATTTGPQFIGIWTLSDTTPCATADYIWDGNCVGEYIDFENLSTTDIGTIESNWWDFDDGTSSTNWDESRLYSSAGNYSVKLGVTHESGCVDSLIQAVQIDARAVADFLPDPDPLVGFPVVFEETGSNATSWAWDFGDGSTGFGERVETEYEVEGNYAVILIANNDENCPDTTMQTIMVNNPSLFLIPNAFTPQNKDYLNATFGLVTDQKITDYRMVVFNRWGQRLFESTEIGDRWDGKYMGKRCPSGSYVYQIRFKDRANEAHIFSGTVDVLE
jgi:gliding motility-associated-like protein